MIEMLMGAAIAFGISFYAIPAVIHLAKEKGLYDFPDDRKVHFNPIPSLGGLGIYAGFIVAFILSVGFDGSNQHLQYLVAASLVIFFIGLKDDLLNISPFKKFLGQVTAAILLVFKGGFVIQSMGGFLGLYDLQPVAAEVFSVVTFVVIINAYNLIDGIDGLAGTLTFLLTGFFAVYYAVNLDWAYACLATSFCAAMGAFLIFNFPPAKIFMGDTGSLTAGLVVGCLAIHFIAEAPTAPVWQVQSAAALSFALLFVPLFDTMRVFSYRIFHGVSPFTPDRNHIHHILLRFGWSHLAITGFLSALSVAIAGLAFAFQSVGNNLLLFSLVAGGYLLIGIALYAYKRRKVRLVRQRFPRIVPPEEEASVMAIAAKKAN